MSHAFEMYQLFECRRLNRMMRNDWKKCCPFNHWYKYISAKSFSIVLQPMNWREAPKIQGEFAINPNFTVANIHLRCCISSNVCYELSCLQIWAGYIATLINGFRFMSILYFEFTLCSIIYSAYQTLSWALMETVIIRCLIRFYQSNHDTQPPLTQVANGTINKYRHTRTDDTDVLIAVAWWLQLYTKPWEWKRLGPQEGKVAVAGAVVESERKGFRGLGAGIWCCCRAQPTSKYLFRGTYPSCHQPNCAPSCEQRLYLRNSFLWSPCEGWIGEFAEGHERQHWLFACVDVSCMHSKQMNNVAMVEHRPIIAEHGHVLMRLV